MDSELHSVQYHKGEFVGVGSDGGRVAPDLDDIEEGLFPFECLSAEAKVLVKAYSLIRKVEFFLVGIVVGAAGWCFVTDDWTPLVFVGFCLLIVGRAFSACKTALKEAIDSEAERREEILHYRELNQQICLRAMRERD